MAAKDKLSVEEFIIKNTLPDLVNGLKELSNLKYPIQDKHSYECLLNQKVNILSNESFAVTDFPITSSTSAFEKYLNKFLPFPIPFPFPRLRPELPPDQIQTPSACEVYYRDFGRTNPGAADCACRVYQSEVRKVGVSHLQATIRGAYAAIRYVRDGVCVLDLD